MRFLTTLDKRLCEFGIGLQSNYWFYYKIICFTKNAILFRVNVSLTTITQVATYFANALVGGVSNPDLEQKT